MKESVVTEWPVPIGTEENSATDPCTVATGTGSEEPVTIGPAKKESLELEFIAVVSSRKDSRGPLLSSKFLENHARRIAPTLTC